MRTSLIVVFLLTAIAVNAQLGTLPEKPKILIVGVEQTSGDMEGSNEFLSMFEGIVDSEIRKEINCAEVISLNQIRSMLMLERTRVLLSASNESNLDIILKNFKCDILITLNIIKVGDTYTLGGSTILDRNCKVTGRYNQKSERDEMVKNIKEYARKLVRDLLASEICAYKGVFTYTLVRNFSESKENTGLPGIDCDYGESYKKEDKSEETWSFNKVKRLQAEVNVNYSINNSESASEHSNCYHCQVMEGDYLLDQFEPNTTNMNSSTVITETYNATKAAKINPEALFEKYNGEVKIIFNTLANNYTINVKAVTEPAKFVRKTEHKESGCPYHKNSDNEIGATYPVSIDRTFGPFLGSPYEKTLKQNVSKTEREKDGKTTTTETISFNLTR